MAISTPTNVAAVTGGSTANAATYDTAVTILTAGRLYLLTVVTYKSTTPAVPTTVTHDPLGTPLSFTLVTDGTQAASVVSFDAAAHRSVSVFRVVPGATTASALIRITGMGSCSSCGWSLTEIATGVNTAAPITKVAVGSGQQTAAIAVTMAAFANAVNLTYLAMAWGDGTANPAETIVATEGRTELEEHNDGERSSLGSDYQNPNGADTSIGATLSATTVDWGAIGIEVASIVAVTSTVAATVVPTVAATGTVINPVTSTAALTVVPAVTAAGSETITGAAALTVVPVVTAAGKETLTGSAALTIVPTVVAAGTQTIPNVTSSATLTVVPTVVAAAAQSTPDITSSAALTVVPVVAATATAAGGAPPDVTSEAALTITPTVSAEATVTAPVAPAPAPGGGTGGVTGATGRAPSSKAQRKIEEEVDRLLEGLLVEPVAEASGEASDYVPDTPSALSIATSRGAPPAPPPPLPGPIRAPKLLEFAPPPEPTPWLLEVPAIDTADDENRLLLIAAALSV